MSMLRMSSLIDRKVHATDGEMGTLSDVYFCDDTWAVKHIVLQTGSFFDRRRLLMAPDQIVRQTELSSAGAPVDIRVNATRSEILDSPDYMDDPPVSEQKAHDPRLHPRFLWFPTGHGNKVVTRPMGAPVNDMKDDSPEVAERGYNPHLRSFVEIRGYAAHVAAELKTSDDDEKSGVGHVEDFMLAPGYKEIVSVVIANGHGHAKREIILDLGEIEHIDWADVRVYLHHAPTAFDAAGA